MYPLTVEDKAFLEQIKKAVLAGDAEAFSSLISYPVAIRPNSKTIKLQGPADVKRHSAAIFTERLKSAVQSQTPDSLFKNWRGVMIGNGEIWFSQVLEKDGQGENWKYRIIGINPEESSVHNRVDEPGIQIQPGPPVKSPSEPKENFLHYVVAKGDTANAICRKFQVSLEQLLASNPGLNVERLWVGQRVRIPKKEGDANPEDRSVNLSVSLPNFELYPAQSNPIGRFAKTKIPESGIDWKMQDYLRFSDDNPLNFAGKYTLFEIGCGTGCIEFCLIDRTTGIVVPGKDFNQNFPEGYNGLMGLQYRQGSSLLVVYHATAFKYPVSVDYYLWDGAKFNLLRSDQIQSRAMR